MVSIAKRMRDLREDHDLTQRDVAQLLGVPAQRVSEWETGFHEPRLDVLMKLADYYAVSLDYLAGMTNTAKRQRRYGMGYNLSFSVKCGPKQNTINFDEKNLGIFLLNNIKVP